MLVSVYLFQAGYSTLMMFALTGANRDEDMNVARRLLEAGNVNKRVLEVSIVIQSS